MVSSTSTSNGLIHDTDKRRKQTVERAKANHLSRQLQMRLQYAKLKVDHGWQKQNLNEVENLYFHHSHQRGPKPYSNLLVTLTTSCSSATVTTPPQSSPSAKNIHFFLPHTRTSENARQRSGLPSPTPHTLPLPTQIQSSSSSRNSDSTTNVLEVVDEGECSTPTNPARHLSSPTSGSVEAIDHGTTNLSPASLTDPVQPSPSLPSSWTSHPLLPSFNHYPNVLLRQSTIQKPVSSSTVIAENSFSFPSTSLTYDSFWSSHSLSTSSRSFRSPPGNSAGYTPNTDVINVGGGSERT